MISGVLYWSLCPIMNPLPQPSGPYAVGKRSYHIIDQNHKDARQPSGYREFMLQLYYPCVRATKDAQRHPYQQDKLEAYKKIKAHQFHLSEGVMQCFLDGITSFAQPDALLAIQADPYPVILFMPGIGTLPLYGALLEELASHGYVIGEIEPPYDVELVVFPGKRVVELDPQFRSAIDRTDRTKIYAYRAEAHARWLHYLKATLNELEILNSDPASSFYRKLDLQYVGVLGHSHGGGVAVDFCAHHDRCKAGVNMDGWTKTANTLTPFKKPFLFLMSEKGIDEVSQLAAAMPEYAKKIDIQGAEHYAVSDLEFLKQPAAWYLGMRSSGPDQVKTFARHILTFFDKHLKDKKHV